jgi:hypothetical protein
MATTDRYSRPIGWLSQCSTNAAVGCWLLSTITFLGAAGHLRPWRGVPIAGTSLLQPLSLMQKPDLDTLAV